jgi:hypothetical protein
VEEVTSVVLEVPFSICWSGGLSVARAIYSEGQKKAAWLVIFEESGISRKRIKRGKSPYVAKTRRRKRKAAEVASRMKKKVLRSTILC